MNTLPILLPVLAEQARKSIPYFGDLLGGGAKSDLLPTIMISAVSLELSWIYCSQESILFRVSGLLKS